MGARNRKAGRNEEQHAARRAAPMITTTPTENIPLRDTCVKNAELRHKCCEDFQQIFGVALSKFWKGNITGFDVIAFDDWLKPHEGESTRDAVWRKYGYKGVSIIERLIWIKHCTEGSNGKARLPKSNR